MGSECQIYFRIELGEYKILYFRMWGMGAGRHGFLPKPHAAYLQQLQILRQSMFRREAAYVLTKVGDSYLGASITADKLFGAGTCG